MAVRITMPGTCKPCKTSCKKPKKRKRAKKEKPEAPKMGAKMDPTSAWWVKDKYIRRRTNWMWRLRPYVRSKGKQCDICNSNIKCHKIPLDEGITSKILRGEECPDFKSMWDKILGDDEPHDWGF